MTTVTTKPRRILGGKGDLAKDIVTLCNAQHLMLLHSTMGYAENIEMCLRAGPLILTGGVRTWALQIARVSVKPKARNKGLFKYWLQEIEDAVAASPTIDAVYVENVFNKHLEAFLQRRGYKQARGWDNKVYSYFKEVKSATEKAPPG